VVEEWLKKSIVDEEWFKKSREADVTQRIPFFCKIGQVEAYIYVHIEPDPHGDDKGTHAHFHAVPHCPKIKIVNYPEPDRCQVTEETCPFWEPVGGYHRDETTRKWVYSQQFIHHISLAEFYGNQLIITALRAKGFKVTKKLPDFRFTDIITLLSALEIINNDVYKNLNELRVKRNTLVHRPEAYKEFEEKELYELALKALELATLLYGKSLQRAV
jgi:hypothetical protein